MRWTFIVLAVLNLAAVGLYFVAPSAGDPVPQLPPVEPGMPPLQTLVERDGPNVVYPERRYCFSFGPFPKSFLATKAKVRLENLGVESERRITQGKERAGYWVYLPPLPDKEAAIKVTQELAYHKIDDFFIVLAAEKENAISLGMYKHIEGAEKRIAELRDKGFEVEMEERYLPVDIHWLDFEQGTPNPMEHPAWQTVTSEYPEQGINPRQCP